MVFMVFFQVKFNNQSDLPLGQEVTVTVLVLRCVDMIEVVPALEVRIHLQIQQVLLLIMILTASLFFILPTKAMLV